MTTTAKGAGSLRERRPGVWEIRVAAGTDPVIQRSLTFHGSAIDAEVYRRELAAEYVRRRAATRAAPLFTVGELLERWLLADHHWRPSTWIGYRSAAGQLAADPALADQRVVSLTPRQLRATFARWSAAGATASVIGGRFRALRSAIGWAHDERIIDYHLIRTMARVVSNPAACSPMTSSVPCSPLRRRTCSPPSPTTPAALRARQLRQ